MGRNLCYGMAQTDILHNNILQFSLKTDKILFNSYFNTVHFYSSHSCTFQNINKVSSYLAFTLTGYTAGSPGTPADRTPATSRWHHKGLPNARDIISRGTSNKTRETVSSDLKSTEKPVSLVFFKSTQSKIKQSQHGDDQSKVRILNGEWKNSFVKHLNMLLCTILYRYYHIIIFSHGIFKSFYICVLKVTDRGIQIREFNFETEKV